MKTHFELKYEPVFRRGERVIYASIDGIIRAEIKSYKAYYRFYEEKDFYDNEPISYMWSENEVDDLFTLYYDVQCLDTSKITQKLKESELIEYDDNKFEKLSNLFTKRLELCGEMNSKVHKIQRKLDKEKRYITDQLKIINEEWKNLM